ncbi:PAS domain-containing sensor histidine kinase [Achromobacter deleyi]|uniref:PAS domain-containing sensor histidine kinase n=1 Tax=Achromobacter deleyi TaxID=1353891 RepID=UPI001491DE33|nr:PAS domain-containing sensor histidine kinase [Achromobacter deleyi]QVQ28447.1 PAS domain S-box protein [Achromobacter deleyi]UIP18551.1 PAS domain S-box protein [Achromobacter deleyi]
MNPEFPSDDPYRLLVDAVMDYAIYLLDVNGMVSSWNPGAERFKGYRADEIIGQHFSVFYTEEDRAAGIPRIALETATREGRFEAEGWRVRKDGSRFWCSVVIDPVHDDHGRLVGFAKITRDITEQKLRREELQAARDSMHQAQRMEAIGRLTGGVAHDFNNFLTAIRFSAEFLKRSPDLPASLMRYVAITIETTERAAQLTRQLLAYAKKQPLQPHVFDVRESLSSLRQLFEASIGSSIALTYELGPGDCTIFADPGQLESALLNLVINARDAMPAGGKLTISARHVDRAPSVSGASSLHGPHVALSVQDTGLGIAQDMVAHVFEPFFSTKAKHENSGLGLSQVQGFVRQSGGDVEVQSAVGQGTTFTLYLPAAETPNNVMVAAGGDSTAEISAHNDILLVEDNRMVGEVVSTLLTGLGQNLTWAVDAESAFRMLQEKGGRFDIAILDVVLPGMNGVELAHKIRAQWPYIRIVLATGYSEALAGKDAFAFQVMQKPYSVEALARLLVED